MGSCVCNDCPENVAKGSEGRARAAVDESSTVLNICSQGRAEGLPEVSERGDWSCRMGSSYRPLDIL